MIIKKPKKGDRKYEKRGKNVSMNENEWMSGGFETCFLFYEPAGGPNLSFFLLNIKKEWNGRKRTAKKTRPGYDERENILTSENY